MYYNYNLALALTLYRSSHGRILWMVLNDSMLLQCDHLWKKINIWVWYKMFAITTLNPS